MNDLPESVQKLLINVANMPLIYQERLATQLAEIVSYARRQRQVIRAAQDALQQLRLDIKYLIFDLEATRRERNELREKLGDLFD